MDCYLSVIYIVSYRNDSKPCILHSALLLDMLGYIKSRKVETCFPPVARAPPYPFVARCCAAPSSAPHPPQQIHWGTPQSSAASRRALGCSMARALAQMKILFATFWGAFMCFFFRECGEVSRTVWLLRLTVHVRNNHGFAICLYVGDAETDRVMLTFKWRWCFHWINPCHGYPLYLPSTMNKPNDSNSTIASTYWNPK